VPWFASERQSPPLGAAASAAYPIRIETTRSGRFNPYGLGAWPQVFKQEPHDL